MKFKITQWWRDWRLLLLQRTHTKLKKKRKERKRRMSHISVFPSNNKNNKNDIIGVVAHGGGGRAFGATHNLVKFLNQFASVLSVELPNHGTREKYDIYIYFYIYYFIVLYFIN